MTTGAASPSSRDAGFGLDGLGVSRRRPAAILLALALTAFVSAADYLTGYQVRLSILYLVPVALATWAAGLAAGVFVTVVASSAWALMFRASHTYSGQWFFYWDAALNIGIFLLFAVLLARLRTALERSDVRFVTAMQSLDAAVFATDARGGRILFANRRFMDTFPEAAHERDAAPLETRFALTPSFVSHLTTSGTAIWRRRYPDKHERREQ